jgi:hypothetical protein
MNDVFERDQVEEILSKASKELKQGNRDFILSNALKLEEAMLAYDLENPRMDKYLIKINNVPLYQFNPPSKLSLTDTQVISLMDYSIRALFTWMIGKRPLSDTIAPITAFIKPSTISHHRTIHLFVLGCWRAIDLTSDLVISSEVVKKDEFIFGTSGLLPVEASRAKNNIILSDLQEHELTLKGPGSIITDLYWRIRFIKFWIILLTGLHLGQPIQLIINLLSGIKECLGNLVFDAFPDLDLIGVYPLMCNLYTNSCPKLQIEPVSAASEFKSFLFDSLFPDISLLSRLESQSYSELIEYFKSLPFQSTLGRCIFTYVLFKNRFLYSSPKLLHSGDGDQETNFAILKILLHSPPRQWRLFRKEPELLKCHSLALHWIILGTKLGLLEESELREAEEWIEFIKLGRNDLHKGDHDQRYLYRWAPLIKIYSNFSQQ